MLRRLCEIRSRKQNVGELSNDTHVWPFTTILFSILYILSCLFIVLCECFSLSTYFCLEYSCVCDCIAIIQAMFLNETWLSGKDSLSTCFTCRNGYDELKRQKKHVKSKKRLEILQFYTLLIMNYIVIKLIFQVIIRLEEVLANSKANEKKGEGMA